MAGSASKWRLTKKDEADIKVQLDAFSSGLFGGDPTNEDKIAEHKAKLERAAKEGKAMAAANKKVVVPIVIEVEAPQPQAPKPQAQETTANMVNTAYYEAVLNDVEVIKKIIPGIDKMPPSKIDASASSGIQDCTGPSLVLLF